MCGPIVLAVPAATGRVAPQLTYNIGRVITYTAVGAALGALGAGLLALTPGEEEQALTGLTRIQVGMSVFAAAFLLVLGLARLGLIPEPGFMRISSPSKLPGFARLLGRAGSTRGSALANLVFGLVMGFLPCGLSFAAFARALPAGSALDGALMVGAFGLGTLPALLVLGTAASRLARKHVQLSNLLSGVLMIGMGAMMGVDALVTL
jgi:sulfite exporter TauE/SafE